MPFAAPETDLTSAFKAPDDEVIGGFKAPDDEVTDKKPDFGYPEGLSPIQYENAARQYTENEKSGDFTAATGGGLPGLVSKGIGAIQNNIIEPAVARGLSAMTGNLVKVEPGKPLLTDEMLPLAKEQGIIPALTRTAQGLSTPGNLAMLPLAAESKLVQGGFAAGAVSSIPESLQKFVSAQTPEEKKDAATELGLNVAFAALMGKGAVKEKPITTIGETDAGKQLDILGSQLNSADVGKLPEISVAGKKLTPEQVLDLLKGRSENEASKPTELTKQESPSQSPLTPRDEKDRPVTIQKADGTTYQALARGGETDFMGKQGIGRMTPEGISDGILGKGEKIVEPVKTEAANPVAQAGGGESRIVSEPPVESTTPKPAEPVKETTGIAHRVSESEGMAAERGEGISAEESVEKGRELLSKGANPQKVIDDFNNDQERGISPNAMAIVRAHNEVLAKAKNEAADKYGVDSLPYKDAWNAQKEWKKKIKPMQTAWHESGMAQQGETEVDTGTFQGLQEAYFNTTGKDFTPAQVKEAKTTSEKVKKASSEADAAKKQVFDNLAKEPRDKPKARLSDKIVAELDKRAGEALKRIKSRSGRLSAGLDPTDLADHAIYGAAKIAKGAVKFADWSAQMVKDLGEYVKPHLKQIWAAANKELSKHDEVKAVWNGAKGYLDQGETNFDNLVHKLAADFGKLPKEIRELLSQPKTIRKITDDMYRKMDMERKMRNQAKDWLQNAKYPKWMQFLKRIPKAFFSAKVFGHGTVGMITHAGNQIFNLPAAKSYWTNFFRQYKLMGVHDQGVYHEQMMQDLIRDPNFIRAKRAGLANDPFKYTDDYQNQFMVKFFHKIGLMGNRGFDALKLFRQERFNSRWESLPDSLKTPEMAKLLADIGNHETGVVKARMGGETASWILFAPKLEGSRWMFLIGDPAKASKIVSNWKDETKENKEYAKREMTQKAIIAGTYFGALAINQGFLSATGSNQKINWTNPLRGDWLSFKIAGHNLGIVSPMIGAVRFLVNIAHDSRGKRTNFEKLQSSRAEEAGKDAWDYGRMKLSPFSKVATDVTFQSDYAERQLPFSDEKNPKYLRKQGIKPYTYTEYVGETFLPIPLEDAIKTGMKHAGMGDSDIKVALEAIATAAIVGGTGARLSDDTHLTEPAQ